MRVFDVTQGGRVLARATVMQQKTGRPVRFELTEHTREAVSAWIAQAGLKPDSFLFPSRISRRPHLSTRQYARLVNDRVTDIGLDPAVYGTHSQQGTQGNADLPPNPEPARRSTFTWPYETGKHSLVPRHRGR